MCQVLSNDTKCSMWSQSLKLNRVHLSPWQSFYENMLNGLRFHKVISTIQLWSWPYFDKFTSVVLSMQQHLWNLIGLISHHGSFHKNMLYNFQHHWCHVPSLINGFVSWNHLMDTHNGRQNHSSLLTICGTLCQCFDITRVLWIVYKTCTPV